MFIYRKNKKKFRYHVGDANGTACRMENSQAFRKLNVISDRPPPGRRLCAICNERTKGAFQAATPTSVDLAQAAPVCVNLTHFPGRPCGRRFGSILRELDQASVDTSAAVSPVGLLMVLCAHKHASPPSTQFHDSAAIRCLEHYQRHGVLALDTFIRKAGPPSRKDDHADSSERKVKPRKRPKGFDGLPTAINEERGAAGFSVAFITSSGFLASPEWRRVRYAALKRSNGCCELCGHGKPHGAVLNVDHIKPRRKYPELALRLDNLQVLCGSCNHGKGNWDETDWRRPEVLH